MMKKYIIYSLILSFAGFLSSCDDFLNPQSESSFTEDVIFGNSAFAEGEIMGVYNIIGENNSYRNRLWLQMGVNTDLEYRSGWNTTSPLAPTKSDDMIALYASEYNMPDGYNNTDNANPWSRIYQAIERANLAISGIRKYGKPEIGTELGHLLGEALTLRAYFYYDLIKWWGDVPGRFEPLTSENLYVGKMNRDEIYNQIIEDLGEATQLMNPAGAKYCTTVKRLSREAARGLRARIALAAAGYSMRPVGSGDSEIKITATDARRRELYEIAREECRAIIQSGIYSLDASFKNVFYQQCQDVESHGREAIFELPYNLGVRGRMLYNFAIQRVADGQASASGSFNSVALSPQFKIMPSFFYDYDPADTRRDISVVPYRVDRNTTLGVMEESLGAGVTGFNLGKWRAEWCKIQITGTDDGVSPIDLRYADVLLMFAEADLFLGGNQGQEYFNQVRRRAFGVAINSSSSYDLPLTLDNIKKERAFEFVGENIRKYDLMRWGELKSAIDKAKQNLRNLRDGAGNYATVPNTIYYKYIVATDKTPGERELVIYGMNRGENDDKTVTDPAGGWTKKSWTNATTGTPAAPYLSDGFIDNMYQGNPDKRQLLPIMRQILISSDGKLTNDYGYQNN